MDGYFFLKDVSEEIIDINLDIHLDELKNKFKNSRVCINGINIKEVSEEDCYGKEIK